MSNFILILLYSISLSHIAISYLCKKQREESTLCIDSDVSNLCACVVCVCVRCMYVWVGVCVRVCLFVNHSTGPNFYPITIKFGIWYTGRSSEDTG